MIGTITGKRFTLGGSGVGPEIKDRALRNNSNPFAGLPMQRKIFELQFTRSCGMPASPSDRIFYLGLNADA